MTLQERSDLILTLARLLHINGQATEQTVGAAEEVGRSLGNARQSFRAGGNWNFERRRRAAAYSPQSRLIQPV